MGPLFAKHQIMRLVGPGDGLFGLRRRTVVRMESLVDPILGFGPVLRVCILVSGCVVGRLGTASKSLFHPVRRTWIIVLTL
jgi:hypothetical protein